MMNRVALYTGRVVLVLIAFLIFGFLIEAILEATVGSSDDRKCEEFARLLDGEALNIGAFGACSVETDGFSILGQDIRRVNR